MNKHSQQPQHQLNACSSKLALCKEIALKQCIPKMLVKEILSKYQNNGFENNVPAIKWNRSGTIRVYCAMETCTSDTARQYICSHLDWFEFYMYASMHLNDVSDLSHNTT